VHTLHGAGHNVHVDDLDGLVRIIAPTLCEGQ
jgi:hypothetical protein